MKIINKVKETNNFKKKRALLESAEIEA